MDQTGEKKTNNNGAIEYICEKYQKEFKPFFYENSDLLSNIKIVHCYTEEMNSKKEYVEIGVFRENDEERYVDNYFSFSVRAEAEKYIGEMVESEFSEYKVYREKDKEAMPSELTCENTLEDLYRINSKYWMSVKIYVKGDSGISEAEYKEKIRNIEKKLLESRHRYTIYIFVVSDEVFQSLERYNQDDFLKFYAENRKPDGKKYFYLYKNIIKDGGVI